MKHLIILSGILFLTLSTYSQSEKKIKTLGITKTVITQTHYEDGLKETYVLEEKYFNKEGKLIEHKDFNKEGKLKEWQKFTYTEKGELETETTLNSKGNMVKMIKYEYKNGMKISKHYYDAKSRLIKTKSYEYSINK